MKIAVADFETGLIRPDGPAYDIVYDSQVRELRQAISRVRRPSYHEKLVIGNGRDGLSVRVDETQANAEVGEDVDMGP